MNGIDVSYSQGNRVDWDAAHASGKAQFVISRCAYGTNPANDDGDVFIRNHDECKRLGIPFGTYIFFLFHQDPEAQAEHLVAVANGRYGQIRPVVDVEEGSGSTGSAEGNIEALGKFNARIGELLGCQPIIYTNADTWDTTMGGTDGFAGHSLWVANYPKPPGHPAMPRGFTSWQIHQYSNQGLLPGFPGYVDLDYAPTLDGLLR